MPESTAIGPLDVSFELVDARAMAAPVALASGTAPSLLAHVLQYS